MIAVFEQMYNPSPLNCSGFIRPRNDSVEFQVHTFQKKSVGLSRNGANRELNTTEGDTGEENREKSAQESHSRRVSVKNGLGQCSDNTRREGNPAFLRLARMKKIGRAHV